MTGVTHGRSRRPTGWVPPLPSGKEVPRSGTGGLGPRAGAGLGLQSGGCTPGMERPGQSPPAPSPELLRKAELLVKETPLSDSRPAGSSSLGTLGKGGPGWDKAFRGHILTALGDKLPLHIQLFPMSGDRAG